MGGVEVHSRIGARPAAWQGSITDAHRLGEVRLVAARARPAWSHARSPRPPDLRRPVELGLRRRRARHRRGRPAPAARAPLHARRARRGAARAARGRWRGAPLGRLAWHYAFTNTFSEEQSRGSTSAPRPGVGLDLLGQRAGQHPSRPRRHLRRLPQRRSRAAAVHLGQRGPPHAAQDPAVQRPALQVRHGHRDQASSRARTCCPRRTAGKRSPTTPWTGRSSHAGQPAARVKDVRLTHIGGPTVLIEVGGWRLLTDPTFDPPGAGTSSAGARCRASSPGPRSRRPTCRRSTRSCSATTTTATTSTPPAARCCRRPGVVVTTASGRQRLGGERPRARAVADDAARGARPAGDRDHRHAVPARPAAQPPDRRRRDRLRAALGRPGGRRAVDLGRHRALRRRARGRRPARRRHGAAAPRRRALPGVGAACATR